MLIAQGADGERLATLPLRALTRMTVTSRYPLDDTPPLDHFDLADGPLGDRHRRGGAALGGAAGSADGASALNVADMGHP